MSKLLLGTAIGELSGSLAGTTFQRGPYGLVSQTKVTQKFSRSQAQSKVRQSFKLSANTWSGLTPAERQTWIDNTAPGAEVYAGFMSANIPITIHSGAPNKTYTPPPPEGQISTEFAHMYVPSGEQNPIWSFEIITVGPIDPASYYIAVNVAVADSAGSMANTANGTGNYYFTTVQGDYSNVIHISPEAAPDGSAPAHIWPAGYNSKASVKYIDKASGATVIHSSTYSNYIPDY